MVVETYFTMNARIVAILRQGSNPMALYAAQRIEELEQVAAVRGECLKTAMEALKWCASNTMECVADEAMIQIRQRLTELEPEEKVE